MNTITENEHAVWLAIRELDRLDAIGYTDIRLLDDGTTALRFYEDDEVYADITNYDDAATLKHFVNNRWLEYRNWLENPNVGTTDRSFLHLVNLLNSKEGEKDYTQTVQKNALEEFGYQQAIRKLLQKLRVVSALSYTFYYCTDEIAGEDLPYLSVDCSDFFWTATADSEFISDSSVDSFLKWYDKVVEAAPEGTSHEVLTQSAAWLYCMEVRQTGVPVKTSPQLSRLPKEIQRVFEGLNHAYATA